MSPQGQAATALQRTPPIHSSDRRVDRSERPYVGERRRSSSVWRGVHPSSAPTAVRHHGVAGYVSDGRRLTSPSATPYRRGPHAAQTRTPHSERRIEQHVGGRLTGSEDLMAD